MFKFVGDPVAQMVGQETTIAERDALRERLGLNDPFVVQFVRYMADVAQADFGLSFRTGRPVDTMLAERLPATLELALVAAIYALVVGIPMGVYTGLYPNTALSRLFQAISLAGISLPTFFVGILLILLFGVVLGWLPTFGRGETVQLGWWSSGPLHSQWPEVADSTGLHPRHVSAHSHHAPRSLRNVGSLAHRLH